MLLGDRDDACISLANRLKGIQGGRHNMAFHSKEGKRRPVRPDQRTKLLSFGRNSIIVSQLEEHETVIGKNHQPGW